MQMIIQVDLLPQFQIQWRRFSGGPESVLTNNIQRSNDSTIPYTWNMPCLSPQPSSPDQSALSSSPDSQTLEKHSRDGSMLRPSKPRKGDNWDKNDFERGVLVPKTLRINDPVEVAKSSIWSMVGIKTENTDSGTGASLCKAFLPKAAENNHIRETSLALQANPAAMSRSLNFQETT